jgi:hypothetical protein
MVFLGLEGISGAALVGFIIEVVDKGLLADGCMLEAAPAVSQGFGGDGVAMSVGNFCSESEMVYDRKNNPRSIF